MIRVALDSDILIYAEVEPDSEKGGSLGRFDPARRSQLGAALAGMV
jgi:hypothetical protein